MAQTKKDRMKSVDKKTTAKTAKKAIARAKKSVKAARKAVRDSTKKLRKKAAALSRETKKLAAQHAIATRKPAAQAKTADTQSVSAPHMTPPATKTPRTTASPAPGETAPPKPPTLIELRQRAKAQKIAGYSRLNKAALISALDSARPA